ncbi:hypothetical protein [Streptomyces milbemycinicus]|uniref:hypothetical protein n=1 Tax=Streptomyces milbemycinicus TaxID=476552 RepID=UPI00340EDBA4
MAQSTGRSVGQAALFAIIFGAVGGGGAWIVGGGLQGSRHLPPMVCANRQQPCAE